MTTSTPDFAAMFADLDARFNVALGHLRENLEDAHLECPAWCRTPHPDDLGDLTISAEDVLFRDHDAPKFSAWIGAGASTEVQTGELQITVDIDTVALNQMKGGGEWTPTLLRQLAADALAAAEWLDSLGRADSARAELVAAGYAIQQRADVTRWFVFPPKPTPTGSVLNQTGVTTTPGVVVVPDVMGAADWEDLVEAALRGVDTRG